MTDRMPSPVRVILKMEAELYKRLEHRGPIRSGDPEKPTTSYTDEELNVMMRALAQHRQGLPSRR